MSSSSACLNMNTNPSLDGMAKVGCSPHSLGMLKPNSTVVVLKRLLQIAHHEIRSGAFELPVFRGHSCFSYLGRLASEPAPYLMNPVTNADGSYQSCNDGTPFTQLQPSDHE